MHIQVFGPLRFKDLFGRHSVGLYSRMVFDDMEAETSTATVAHLLVTRHYRLNAGQRGP